MISFPLFAAGIVDTGDKLATSINNTSETGGKFAVGVVDTCMWCILTCAENFLKQFETVLATRGLGGKLIHEKNQKQKIS